ncbi:MAG: S1C family serine protease [Fimbriimonas sp.]
MKKSAVVLTSVACFVGVLGALQLDRWMTRAQNASVVGSAVDSAFARPAVLPVADPMGGPVAAPDFRAAAKKVMPSVVSVDQYVRYRRMWESDTQLQETGTGSGVIISRNGLVVTNNHVIADPRDPTRRRVASEIRVRLSDRRTLTAKVLGNDPRSDLAVLKIEATDLTPVDITDAPVEVGQWVLAVGNPLGFDNTVSVGVVSSKGRSIDIERLYLTDSIQTDAAINPGNSGGALADAQGRLIGINSAIASRTGQSIGIGFAIPVNRMKRVVDDIVKLGYVRYAGLGVSYNETSVAVLADPNGRAEVEQLTGATPPPSGVLLLAVGQNSAADKAGIRQWDVLLEMDGKPLKDLLTLNGILNSKKPGDQAKVRVWSKGQERSLNVTLQEIRS